MANKVQLLVAVEAKAAKVLKEKEGRLTECRSFDTIPLEFKEVIRQFIMDNVGFETGPIFCLTRLNGEDVSLRTAGDGDLRVEDVLPLQAGDMLFELSMNDDMMVSIGMDKLFDLTQKGEEFGNNNEVILDMLRDSLVVGPKIGGEENVFSFIPNIEQQHCSKFVRLDENWSADYKDIFSNIQDVSPSALSMF